MLRFTEEQVQEALHNALQAERKKFYHALAVMAVLKLNYDAWIDYPDVGTIGTWLANEGSEEEQGAALLAMLPFAEQAHDRLDAESVAAAQGKRGAA